MKRRQRKIFVALGVILGLVAFGFLTKTFWRDQFRVFYLGQVEFAAEHYQDLPRDIDTVEVFTLSDFSDYSDPDYKNGFYLDGNQIAGTLNHKTLTGADAKEVVELWGAFQIGRELQAMCFNPAYGLQFKRNGKIYFQTSVCWECSGYTLPVRFFGTVQYGFNSKNEGAQKLLKILEQHVPLPQRPEKSQLKNQAVGNTNL
jgi:hypothetical protein